MSIFKEDEQQVRIIYDSLNKKYIVYHLSLDQTDQKGKILCEIVSFWNWQKCDILLQEYDEDIVFDFVKSPTLVTSDGDIRLLNEVVPGISKKIDSVILDSYSRVFPNISLGTNALINTDSLKKALINIKPSGFDVLHNRNQLALDELINSIVTIVNSSMKLDEESHILISIRIVNSEDDFVFLNSL